jgi:hypothetical protein
MPQSPPKLTVAHSDDAWLPDWSSRGLLVFDLLQDTAEELAADDGTLGNVRVVPELLLVALLHFGS